jgi:hypothetical protein
VHDVACVYLPLAFSDLHFTLHVVCKIESCICYSLPCIAVNYVVYCLTYLLQVMSSSTEHTNVTVNESCSWGKHKYSSSSIIEIYTHCII